MIMTALAEAEAASAVRPSQLLEKTRHLLSSFSGPWLRRVRRAWRVLRHQ